MPSADAALAALRALRANDERGAHPWGGIYSANSDLGTTLSELQAAAFKELGSSNALYPGVWPSVATMQAELLAWCLRLLNGEGTPSCGLLTSGGTESILLSVLAHREEARARGIERPQIIASSTCHGAAHKAAFYFGLDLTIVEPDPATQRLTRADVERALTPRTCLVYTSAPSFPHGVVDDVRGIGALARERGFGMHVDQASVLTSPMAFKDATYH